ncbi:hypothetical protein ASPWEDRAFT_717301 [Aspergillus wentii DTO 134E9]|uniref:Jacalin-type lectin domain-containing protein n=1 Tax=Aspergillus wentii DTO 134E9 TaxID=1073089 RepID=A0A1L9R6M3_ASPWE|nr:uncharacterized protein ASPWEDRAFT_717301 [Aspergillus wentii DTO 134E9]KAI9926801.1 hypothetical protein MW887_003897 [Aspergillus wentii]OJJ30533.1 hypothetical protein ASPWEDRAFT_717301 [Aspergillus wentii DTO 134E9]
MKIAGKTAGDSKTPRFAPGERCTDLSLWANGIGTRCGRIRIYTSEGQSFDWGMHGGKDEYPIDVGSGILVGFCGEGGSDIDRLGALFIKPIRRIVSSVDYGQLPPGRQGIQSIELDSYQHVNKSSSDLNWSWRKSVSKTSSQTLVAVGQLHIRHVHLRGSWDSRSRQCGRGDSLGVEHRGEP